VPPGATCPIRERNPWDPVVWVNPAQPPSVSRCAPRSRSPVSLIVLTRSCSCRWGPCPSPTPRLACPFYLFRCQYPPIFIEPGNTLLQLWRLLFDVTTILPPALFKEAARRSFDYNMQQRICDKFLETVVPLHIQIAPNYLNTLQIFRRLKGERFDNGTGVLEHLEHLECSH